MPCAITDSLVLSALYAGLLVGLRWAVAQAGLAVRGGAARAGSLRQAWPPERCERTLRSRQFRSLLVSRFPFEYTLATLRSILFLQKATIVTKWSVGVYRGRARRGKHGGEERQQGVHPPIDVERSVVLCPAALSSVRVAANHLVRRQCLHIIGKVCQQDGAPRVRRACERLQSNRMGSVVEKAALGSGASVHRLGYPLRLRHEPNYLRLVQRSTPFHIDFNQPR